MPTAKRMYRANLIGSKATRGFEVVDGGLTVTAGGLTITAGGLTINSGNVTITDNLTVNGDVTLGDAIADTISLNGALTSNVTYAIAGTWCYFRSTITATSGDHNNARFRVQASAVGANTGEQRAIYAQGISSASLYGGTVTGVQVESIAKDQTTVVTLRGIFVGVDSEGTPTSITNMHGIHCRMKTSVAPATDYYNTILETEKFGSGVALDAFLLFKTTTWTGAETIATNIIDLSGITGTATVGIEFGSNLTLTKGINITAAGIQRALDVQSTPTTADRMIYMSIDYGANSKEAMYIIAKSATNSGETMAIRGRAEGKHASASGGEHRGGFFQGIATASLFAGTVTGVQSEAIAKDGTTVTTVRGAFFAADSEGTPTSITNMYGFHTRVKTSVAPATDFYAGVIESEKFGSGVTLDAFLYFKTTTWQAANTVAVNVIDLSGITGIATTGIEFGSNLTLTQAINITGAGIQRAIDIQVTPTTADRQIYMNIDYGANSKEAVYVIAKSATNSGETIAIRGRAEGKHASASGGEHRGGFFQGIATASLFAGTVTGVQSEAIAKDGTTVTTVRGAFFAADSEGTPTSITNMYGFHTRVKTSVAPATDFYAGVIESEKFGSGVTLDAFLYFKTTTWQTANSVSTSVIDMTGITGNAGAVLSLPDDQVIGWDNEEPSTPAGSFKVLVGGSARYVMLYSTAPS